MLDRTDLPGSCPVPAHLTTLGVSPRPATPLLRTPQWVVPLTVHRALVVEPHRVHRCARRGVDSHGLGEHP
ncbi:hypothetical protein Ae505Ps2_2404c [Pseudonocardia sp. Ae505_Ps2]|nr:hypothetical protein Ae505Ps2_2402c [Pseudonocardia sp. Ae505_Ps2]OLM12276.1 hypothetical protein Ae505Ps2_2404c [Pseudonocardia sp. Ae505_Ps2]